MKIYNGFFTCKKSITLKETLLTFFVYIMKPAHDKCLISLFIIISYYSFFALYLFVFCLHVIQLSDYYIYIKFYLGSNRYIGYYRSSGFCCFSFDKKIVFFFFNWNENIRLKNKISDFKLLQVIESL